MLIIDFYVNNKCEWFISSLIESFVSDETSRPVWTYLGPPANKEERTVINQRVIYSPDPLSESHPQTNALTLTRVFGFPRRKMCDASGPIHNFSIFDLHLYPQ
jgi:hypothetical protein